MAGALLGAGRGVARLITAGAAEEERALGMQDRRDRLRLLQAQIRAADANREVAMAANERAERESRQQLEEASTLFKQRQAGIKAEQTSALNWLQGLAAQRAATPGAAATDEMATLRDWLTQAERSISAPVTAEDVAAVAVPLAPRKPGKGTPPASRVPGAPAPAPGTPAAPAAPSFVQHTVARNENLTRIAARYGTTVAAIAAANGIRNPNVIRRGQVLRIPMAAAAPASAAPAAVPGPAGEMGPPEPETPGVLDIAAAEAMLSGASAEQAGTRFGLAELESALGRGEFGTPEAATYTVRAGDRLAVIAARELGDAQRWREIAVLNDIDNPRAIQPGQVLQLPPPRAGSAAPAAIPAAPPAAATGQRPGIAPQPGAAPLTPAAPGATPAATATSHPTAALAAAEAAVREAATPDAAAQPLPPRWQPPRMRIPVSMLETLGADAALPAGLTGYDATILAQRMQTQLATLAQTVTAAATTGREPAILAAINAVDALAYAYKGQGVYLPGVQQQLVRHRQLLEQAAEMSADPMTDFQDRMLTPDENERFGTPQGTWMSQVMGRQVPPRPSNNRGETDAQRRQRLEWEGEFTAEAVIQAMTGRQNVTPEIIQQSLVDYVQQNYPPDEHDEMLVLATSAYNDIVSENRVANLRTQQLQQSVTRTASGGTSGGRRTGGGRRSTGTAATSNGAGASVRLNDNQAGIARGSQAENNTKAAQAAADIAYLRSMVQRYEKAGPRTREQMRKELTAIIGRLRETEQKINAHNARYGSDYAVTMPDYSSIAAQLGF